MSNYVLLNLEDKINDTQKGSADSTLIGLRKRYEERKQHRGLVKKFLGSNSVTEYRCVEAAPLKFTDDAARLATIRSACSQAKKIYLVAHGDPRTTDVCYTNNVGSTSGVLRLASATELAAFLARVLVSSKDEFHIALVMCYGARCRNYQSANVNHQSRMANADLVTSFAYRLFHELVSGYNIRVLLSAVTGKIQHDSTTGHALVEHEEVIDVNMEIAEADKAKRAGMIGAVGVLKPQNEQDAAYKANYDAWKSSTAGADAIRRSNDARTDRNAILSRLSANKENEMMHKYGKLVYRHKKGSLTILSKYGNPGGGMKPGSVIYSGPLLSPG